MLDVDPDEQLFGMSVTVQGVRSFMQVNDAGPTHPEKIVIITSKKMSKKAFTVLCDRRHKDKIDDYYEAYEDTGR